MERELLITGIGGQGVQLAATVLAGAAVAEGREVQVFGSYGGMMRGGNTEATIVVADGPIEAPPTVSAAWSAILMHPDHALGALRRVRPGGITLVNSTVFETPVDSPHCTVLEVPAAATAAELGNIMAAAMVMVGAYAAATGLVGLASVVQAAREALPRYRAQHASLNERALHAGFDRVPREVAAAWTDAMATPR